MLCWRPAQRAALLLTPFAVCRHHARGAGQRRVCHLPLHSLTHGSGVERRRTTLTLNVRRSSRPCRELGPLSGWAQPTCGSAELR